MTTETAPAPAKGKPPTAPRIFSGIQPSGVAHLGNDLGAIRNYVRLQDEYEAVYCIVDYHALTSTHDPDVLRARTRDMAASLLALGLDPDVCTLFVQSHRPEHAELAWLLCTVTPVSWLERTPTSCAPGRATWPPPSWPSASIPSAARSSSRATGRSTPSSPGCSPR